VGPSSDRAPEGCGVAHVTGRRTEARPCIRVAHMVVIPSPALKGILWRFRGRRFVRDGFTAWCPLCFAHKPSLRLSQDPAGEPVVRCLSGCSEGAILVAVGILPKVESGTTLATGNTPPPPLLPATRVDSGRERETPPKGPPSPASEPQLPPMRGGGLGGALAFLQDLVGAGPVAATEVRERAETAGVAVRTLKRAKRRLGVRSMRRGTGWFWSVPQKGGHEMPMIEDSKGAKESRTGTLESGGAAPTGPGGPT
jgi:hypothetical protein